MCNHDRDDEDYHYFSGDPRRCPVHPWVSTSSRDGMHDAPCGRCEYEMEVGSLADDEGPDPVPDPNNPVVAIRMGHSIRLSDLPDDDIPF